MSEYIVQMAPSNRVLMIKYADNLEEAIAKANHEKAPGETVNFIFPNESGAVPKEVHEVYHD